MQILKLLTGIDRRRRSDHSDTGTASATRGGDRNELYRANGAVREPGSDDPDVATEVAAFEALQDELNDAGSVDV